MDPDLDPKLDLEMDPDLDQQLEKNDGSGSVSESALKQCESETLDISTVSISNLIKCIGTLWKIKLVWDMEAPILLICIKVNQHKVDVAVLRQALARALPPS
jgi:hypothetical protein